MTRSNEALCSEMDGHLGSSGSLSPTVSKELFESHFGGGAEKQEADHLRVALSQLVGNVVIRLGALGVNVSH